MKPLKEYRRVLVFVRYGIGDLVMELPALEELRRRLSAAHVTAVGARPALELLESDPQIDEIADVRDFGFRHWADYGDEATLQNFSAWLDEKGFDLYVDPSHAVFGAARQVWEREPEAIDSGGSSAEAVLAAGGDGAEALRRAIRDGWGIEVPRRAEPSLRLQKAERTFAQSLLRELGYEGARLVGISPVASSSLKRWDPARFATAADALLQSIADHVVIFAGPQADAADDIRRAMRHAQRTSVIGKLHLRKVAALLEACSLFLGNDTGLAHLAAAVGTPVVAIFGPTSPRIYRPSSNLSRSVGGEDDCPWRRNDGFGPPGCVMEERCFREDPCIEHVPVRQVLTAIRQTAAPPT